jgi:2-iminobutanoate/2-iminopropanoate deaminase
MKKDVIVSEAAPRAVGSYSQAVRANGFVFLSGQIPLDPATGVMVEGDVGVQARRVMDNLGAVLATAGSGFERVMKATIYLVDMADFAVVNQIYGEYFPSDWKPARATVAVAGLPRGSRVEIDMVALSDHR